MLTRRQWHQDRVHVSMLAFFAALSCTIRFASAQSTDVPDVACPGGYTCTASGEDATALLSIVNAHVGEKAQEHAVRGAIVGVSWHGRRSFFGYGKSDEKPFSADTIVEIGSITKVFTTALFGEAIQEQRIRLNDPLQTYASELKIPVLNSCASTVTLQQLANFQSSMPELPSERDGTPLGSVPLAQRGITHYEKDDFLHWVSQWVPAAYRDQQCNLPFHYRYSNASVGLLGYIVADSYATDWLPLVQQRITAPLGMTSTSITVPPADRGRVAQGYGPKDEPVIPWPVFAWFPAGALRSDADDMLAFGEAALGHTVVNGNPTPSALITAMRLAMTTVYPVDDKDGNVLFSQGWAWVETPAEQRPGYVPLYLKDGGTDGFSTVIVVNPSKDLVVFIAFDRGFTPIQKIGEELSRLIGHRS